MAFIALQPAMIRLDEYGIVALFILSSFLLAFFGCVPDDSLEHTYSELLNRSYDLQRRHSELNARVDSLWDATSLQLSEALPPDFPAVDRAIFLKARNMEHMQMFQSYQQLSPETQGLITSAGKADQALAKEIRQLIEQTAALEKQKNQFLQKVERVDKSASRKYAEQLRMIDTVYGQ